LGATCIATGALLLAAPAADARVTKTFLHNHATSIRIRETRILTHHVRVISWRPGNRYIRALVGYSRSAHRVPIWAGANHHRSRSVAAINGGTWTWADNVPVGTVWAMGRKITRIQKRPAVGFLPNGRLIFGARAAREYGSVNIVAGEAYVVKHGRIPRRYPWANAAQIQCSTPALGGCYRSNVVRFKSGRVGLVEIAWASMKGAGRVLRKLHVRMALTLDAGGSSNLWTSIGKGGCVGHVYGHCMGIADARGLNWEREVPDAIIIKVRRHP
jgi:hypothetical protein